MLCKILTTLFRERYGQRYLSSPRVGALLAASFRPRWGFGLLFESDFDMGRPAHPRMSPYASGSLSVELLWLWLLVDVTITKDKVEPMPNEPEVEEKVKVKAALMCKRIEELKDKTCGVLRAMLEPLPDEPTGARSKS